MDDVNWAAIAPLLVLAVGIIAFALVDLSRHEPLHMPRWAWALICVFSVPLGAIVYFMVGRGDPIEPTNP